MCTHRHKAPNGVYYFRMSIPEALRPAFDGKREIKYSLRTKDPVASKALIPDHTKAAYALLDEARRAMRIEEKPTPALPSRAASEVIRRMEQEEASQRAFDDEQRRADAEREARIEDQEGYARELRTLLTGNTARMDPKDAVIVRAIRDAQSDADFYKRLVEDRELALRYIRDELKARGRERKQVPAFVTEEPTGNGVYLDTDIVNGWAAERKPSARGKDAYWRDAKLFNSMMGRKSAELITKADVLAYKRKLIDDPNRSQVNVRDRLAYLRTLLEWGAQNDLIPDNPARDVKMAVTERRPKRKDFSADDLNALFAGPVHSQGARPRGSFGEAAYWMPLIAIFMGARREEIGQLRVCDVRPEPYIDEADQRKEVWCIDITETDDDEEEAGALPTAVKTESSMRLVPLHPKLIELGFIEYVQSLPDQAGRVFPELKPIGIGQKLTDKWGQWFSKYKRLLGITDKLKVFHSLRHTWKTHAGNAGMPERVQREFMGHEGKDTADKYGSAPAMHVLVSAIASFRVPGLNVFMKGG